MASQRVHGITIDLDVNTSGVAQSFSQINKSLNSTAKELKIVDNLLKNDANNTVLMAQKQSLLTDAIEKTSEKLRQLNKAKEEADKITNKTEEQQKDYRALERDIEATTKRLDDYKKQQEDTAQKTEDLANANKEVGESFKEASDGALNFGDIVKANVVADFIVDGIKAMASAAKEFAGELNEWAEGYRELEVYERQFESNLKNTADASDEEIASLKALAKQKERQGVISSKAITSAYQELATYVESSEAIEGLTDSLVDMAAQQYGIDATEESVRNIATTLGKALANGDYSGLTRLGYGFDEAQQKIMEYGTEAERVAVINDVISSSIGGMNEALANTDAGQLFHVASYFDDVKEAVGEVVSELEIGFIQQIMPTLQPFIDDVLKWVIDNKDNFIATAQGVAEWLTSDSMKSFYSDVGQMVQDIAQIMTDLGTVLDDSGILPGLWEGFITIIQGVRDIIHEIAEDIAKIKSGGLGSWMMGNYNSYTWDSGGFGSGGFASGGMMSGNVTVNNSFSINTSSLITESTVRSWADIITEQVNENLGRMV
jgi:hypothetical protein